MGALLLSFDATLRSRAARWIPTDMARVMDMEDLLQDTYHLAFRDLGQLKSTAVDAFYAWLVALAQHRCLCMAKVFRAKKRGEKLRVRSGIVPAATYAALWDVAAQDSLTPTRLAIRKERERLLRIALASLSKDQGVALRLRYLEGASPAAIAERLGRSEEAVHMLCSRGLRGLRAILGDAEMYFSTSHRATLRRG